MMSFRPFNDPQATIRNLQDELNGLMERLWHAGVSTGPLDGQSWAPLIDVIERVDRYVVFVEAPGLPPDQIDLTILGGALTVRGEKQAPPGLKEGDRLLRGERRYGAFCRTIELPTGADGDKLSARYTEGVLEVTIPKSQRDMPKSVKINVEG